MKMNADEANLWYKRYTVYLLYRAPPHHTLSDVLNWVYTPPWNSGPRSVFPALIWFERFEVQVHHLISLGGWNDAVSNIYLSSESGMLLDWLAFTYFNAHIVGVLVLLTV
jgi:hypothetical protein